MSELDDLYKQPSTTPKGQISHGWLIVSICSPTRPRIVHVVFLFNGSISSNKIPSNRWTLTDVGELAQLAAVVERVRGHPGRFTTVHVHSYSG